MEKNLQSELTWPYFIREFFRTLRARYREYLKILFSVWLLMGALDLMLLYTLSLPRAISLEATAVWVFIALNCLLVPMVLGPLTIQCTADRNFKFSRKEFNDWKSWIKAAERYIGAVLIVYSGCLILVSSVVGIFLVPVVFYFYIWVPILAVLEPRVGFRKLFKRSRGLAKAQGLRGFEVNIWNFLGAILCFGGLFYLCSGFSAWYIALIMILPLAIQFGLVLGTVHYQLAQPSR